MPFGLARDELTSMLADHDLPDDFEVVLGTPRSLDPIGEPDAAVSTIERRRRAGATRVGVRLAAGSAAHYCEQLAVLRELVPRPSH